MIVGILLNERSEVDCKSSLSTNSGPQGARENVRMFPKTPGDLFRVYALFQIEPDAQSPQGDFWVPSNTREG